MKTSIYNLIILDKSGSMSSISNEAIAGVNETIGTIKATAKAHADDQEHFFSLVAFCGCERKYIFNNVPIDQVRTITADDYQPCCMTPLYDAIGFSLTRLAAAAEGAEFPLAQVTIITDGYENASKEYDGPSVKALIEKFKAKGWTFVFIGANQDVESVAFELSIKNTMNFSANPTCTLGMFKSLSRASARWASRVSNYAKMSTSREELASCMEEADASVDFFTDEERAEASK